MEVFGNSKFLTATGAVQATGVIHVAAIAYIGPASGIVEFRKGDGTGAAFAAMGAGPSAVPLSVTFGAGRWRRDEGLHATFVGAGFHVLTVWYT